MEKMIYILSLVLFPTPLWAAAGQMHYVKPLQAKIYEKPSNNSKAKFIIAIGRKLVEFDRKSGWIYVGIDKSGGRDGWIKSSDVSRTDPDGMTY